MSVSRSTTRSVSNEGPFWLYRAFDVDDELLYVGITGRGIKRLHQHSRQADWRTEVVRFDIEHFSTLEGVREAEKNAINREKPRFNVGHGGSIKPPQYAGLDYVSFGELDENFRLILNTLMHHVGLPRLADDVNVQNVQWERILQSFAKIGAYERRIVPREEVGGSPSVSALPRRTDG